MNRPIRALTALLLSALLFPATAAAAKPVPSITTTLAFAADCTWASVNVSWTNWRTTQIILALESPTGTMLQIGSTPVRQILNAPDDFRASRHGAGVLRRFYASTYGLTDWTGFTLTGFGHAGNNRGTAINDRDPNSGTGYPCVVVS